MERQFGKITGCSLLLVILSFILITGAAASDMSVELDAGYDDNVSLSSTAEGSAFGSYRIKFYHQLFPDLPSADCDIFIDVSYQDYFRLGDNYELRPGISLTFPLSDGRIVPGIMSEALIYRDDFTEEDDRNEIMAGVQLEWLTTARVSLGFRQTWTWLDYTEPVILQTDIPSLRPGKGWGMPGGPHHHHQEDDDTQEQTSSSRDDHLRSTGIRGTLFLTPAIQTHISLEHNRLDSSVETESYRQNSGMLSLLWEPSDLWEISATTFWKRAEYDQDIENTDRTDTTYDVGLGISYFINNLELFFHVEQTENDSPLDIESYCQTVTQCGLIFSF